MVLQQASVTGIGNRQNHTILKCPSDSVDWSEKTSCSVRRFMVIASLRHDRTRVSCATIQDKGLEVGGQLKSDFRYIVTLLKVPIRSGFVSVK